MMRLHGLGHALLALALVALGLVTLRSSDFALVWQPVPQWVPGRTELAFVSGFVLIAVGVGLVWEETFARAVRALTVYVALWVVLLDLPRVIAEPGNAVRWLGFAEITAILAGALALLSSCTPSSQGWTRWLGGPRGLRIARTLYGAALPLIGLSHFVYSAATAELVPAWLPARIAFAYLTGAGHVAAGLAILLGVLPSLAATLEAVMVSSFVLLVHVPAVARAPHDRVEWTAMSIACAIAGASWVVARSYRQALPRRAHVGEASLSS